MRREEGRDDYYGSVSYIKTHRPVTDDHSAEMFETLQLKYGGSWGSEQERPKNLCPRGESLQSQITGYSFADLKPGIFLISYSFENLQLWVCSPNLILCVPPKASQLVKWALETWAMYFPK